MATLRAPVARFSKARQKRKISKTLNISEGQHNNFLSQATAFTSTTKTILSKVIMYVMTAYVRMIELTKKL